MVSVIYKVSVDEAFCTVNDETMNQKLNGIINYFLLQFLVVGWLYHIRSVHLWWLWCHPTSLCQQQTLLQTEARTNTAEERGGCDWVPPFWATASECKHFDVPAAVPRCFEILRTLSTKIWMTCQNHWNGYGSIPIDTFLVGWTSINPSYFGVH